MVGFFSRINRRKDVFNNQQPPASIFPHVKPEDNTPKLPPYNPEVLVNLSKELNTLVQTRQTIFQNTELTLFTKNTVLVELDGRIRLFDYHLNDYVGTYFK